MSFLTDALFSFLYAILGLLIGVLGLVAVIFVWLALIAVYALESLKLWYDGNGPK